MDKLNRSQIDTIKKDYPQIQQEYLDWMASLGWGEDESGYMIYSSPAYATEILGSECPENIKSVLLVGDDMAGYSIGYIVNDTQCELVGFDSCGWEIEHIKEGLNGYLRS